MPYRNILPIEMYDSLMDWLGDRALEPIGEYEVVRWKNDPGKPMKVVYKCSSKKYFSVGESAYSDVKKFLSSKGTPKNNTPIKANDPCQYCIKIRTQGCHGIRETISQCFIGRNVIEVN